MSKHSHQSPKLRRIALCCAFVLLTALLATSLSGCEAADEGGVVPIPQPEVDLTPTDELVIYVPGMPEYNILMKDLLPAFRAYERKYPNIKLTLEYLGANDYIGTEYVQRLKTEMMAGGGPDIVVAYTDFFPDLYKTIDSGAFLDLSSIAEADEEFNVEDYYKPMLDAGLYRGGRYLVPYGFELQMLQYLPESLEAVGFDTTKSTNAVSFFNELADCLPRAYDERYSEKRVIADYNVYSMNVLNYAGMELIDYENRKVLPDDEGLKAFCEAYKPYWKLDYPTTKEWTGGGFTAYRFLNQGNTLFVCPDNVGRVMYSLREAKDSGNKSMVTLALPAMDGGTNALVKSTLAINSTSKNQLNAWNFIKVMLSEEAQKGDHAGSIGFSINKAAMRYNIELYNEAITPGGSYPDAELTQEEIQNLCDFFDAITGSSINSRTVFDTFAESMIPFFNDEISYEESVKDLKRKLQLYLDE